MACSNCGSGGGVPKGCQSNGSCGTGGCGKLSVYDWLSNMESGLKKQEITSADVEYEKTTKMMQSCGIDKEIKFSYSMTESSCPV